jgi:hypothetical protein
MLARRPSLGGVSLGSILAGRVERLQVEEDEPGIYKRCTTRSTGGGSCLMLHEQLANLRRDLEKIGEHL